MHEFTRCSLVVALTFGLSAVFGCSGGPTTSESSTEGSTSTSGSSTVGDPTSGSSSAETGGSSSAGSTSSGSGSTTTTEQTTGETSTDPPACAAIVGSRECALLAEISPDLEVEQCLLCQGIACGEQASCDDQYPCVAGEIVIQGCCDDDECAGLTPFCGMYSGTNFVCVLNDDV